MMRVLVVQNFDGTGLGQVATALEEAGAAIDLRLAHKGDALPEDAAGHDALIVLGGGQHALADDDYPYFPALCQLMRRFGDEGRAVLGICLGAQLLARAYGAENIVGGASEFAWQEVELTPEGREDPVFAGLPAAFPIFHWHDDTFVLPRGAARLAGNLATHNQAFRARRAAYGIQFHFEADRALVARWSRGFPDAIAARRPDWHDAHEAEAERFGPDADAAGLAIARGWVSLI